MSKAEISRRTGVPANTVSRWTTDFQKPRKHPYKADELVDDQPGDSIHEIEVFETLIAKMLATDAPGPIVATMLAQLAKMRKDWEAGQIRSGQLLSREALQQLASAMVELFVRHFNDVPGFEDRMALVADELAPLINGARNTQRAVNELAAR